MVIKKNTFEIILIGTVIIVLYFFFVHILGERLDIFSTAIHYHRWMEALHAIRLDNQSLFNIIDSTRATIAAPEFFSGILMWPLARLFSQPEAPFTAANILYLLSLFWLIKKGEVNLAIKIVLFLALAIGYYEFINLHVTHRQKIALIFLIWSFTLVENHRRLSDASLILSIGCHLSIILTLPLIFLMRKIGFSQSPKLNIAMAAAILLVTLVALAFTPNSTATFSYFSENYLSTISNKARNTPFSLSTLLLVSIAVVTLAAGARRIKTFIIKEKQRYFLFVTLIILYITSTLAIIGTSRGLMLYYCAFTIIIISSWKVLPISTKKNWILIMLPFYLYSILNGIIKGPLSMIIKY